MGEDIQKELEHKQRRIDQYRMALVRGKKLGAAENEALRYLKGDIENDFFIMSEIEWTRLKPGERTYLEGVMGKLVDYVQEIYVLTAKKDPAAKDAYRYMRSYLRKERKTQPKYSSGLNKLGSQANDAAEEYGRLALGRHFTETDARNLVAFARALAGDKVRTKSGLKHAVRDGMEVLSLHLSQATSEKFFDVHKARDVDHERIDALYEIHEHLADRLYLYSCARLAKNPISNELRRELRDYVDERKGKNPDLAQDLEKMHSKGLEELALVEKEIRRYSRK